ncbi:histidine kinase [Aquimarina sp. ERC-38]|uniref:sensor histidine kinase n=1 Tax=Aquimarina sp. ERC-38 TaxID=2949996 RepID=UPI002247EAC7|nr:histidine kinase [Aquimarina sp. ERC-38]UZO80077.1 histidine kinase [Aquimarina sp. ERC-38]
MEAINVRREIILHSIFWSCIFIFSTASASWYYNETRELFEVYGFRTILQVFVAYTILKFLVPKFLNKGRTLPFILATCLLFVIAHAICTSYLVRYLIPTYPETYQSFLKRFEEVNFYHLYFNFNQFFSKFLYLVYPCAILMAISFYRERQQLQELHEKKREAELSALKNQLNPHFLFNTLNSLYLLALKKSDKTIKVIENLSYILDYMLYRCDKKFVLLEDELVLINKYIELEQLRYGKRVEITFDESINGNEEIAPLLLLTLVENAFKHGVSEAIDTASIQIQIENKESNLFFTLTNSKPQVTDKSSDRKKLGLTNIKKQLELLYPNKHQLHTIDESTLYTTALELCL